MTPSARVSDPPRIVRGIHVELWMRICTPSARCATVDTVSGGIGKTYSRNSFVSSVLLSSCPSIETVTRGGGTPRGRPPLNLNATSRLRGGTLISRYDVSWLQRKVRSPPPSLSFG